MLLPGFQFFYLWLGNVELLKQKKYRPASIAMLGLLNPRHRPAVPNIKRWFPQIIQVGVSIKGGTPKWMVFNGKSHYNGWFRDTPILGKLQVTRPFSYPNLCWLGVPPWLRKAPVLTGYPGTFRDSCHLSKFSKWVFLSYKLLITVVIYGYPVVN